MPNPSPGPWKEPELLRRLPGFDLPMYEICDADRKHWVAYIRTEADAKLVRQAWRVPKMLALLKQFVRLIDHCGDYQSPTPESMRPEWRTMRGLTGEYTDEARELIAEVGKSRGSW